VDQTETEDEENMEFARDENGSFPFGGSCAGRFRLQSPNATAQSVHSHIHIEARPVENRDTKALVKAKSSIIIEA
jgi:hypothetical protein